MDAACGRHRDRVTVRICRDLPGAQLNSWLWRVIRLTVLSLDAAQTLLSLFLRTTRKGRTYSNLGFYR